ncbi:MAG: PAS domain S-box protein, partial [Planctomycetes bacterium]|nr:PAS domain S-box protein [Planctomycetota bacterium]
DTDGNCTFCNAACLKILGYDDERDLLGKNMHSLIHHSYPDGSAYPNEDCQIYKAFRKDQGVHVDNEVLWRKDGSSFPAEYWSYPINENGKVIGAVMTFLDITKRKQTEESLHQTQRTNQLILQAIPDMLVRVSRNGIYKEIHCVKGFEPIWGKENVIGKHLTDVLPADIADQILTAIEKAFASQKMRSLEYTLHIHDQKRWRIQNHPLLQGRGHHHAPRHHQKKKERTSPPPK